MNSYIATRFEQYVQYWWNGSRFVTDKTQAKHFASTEEANEELAQKKALYFDDKKGRWHGRPVNINPA